MLQLQTFQLGHNKSVHGNNVVLPVELDEHSQPWKLPQVRQQLQGKDGLCRVVKVQVSTGITIRPVQKLGPLEVDKGPQQ